METYCFTSCSFSGDSGPVGTEGSPNFLLVTKGFSCLVGLMDTWI